MTTWTCYPDTGWCGLVPIVPTLETKLSESVITTIIPQVATTTISSLTTTSRKTTTRTKNDKPTQTKTESQSEQTQRTESEKGSTTPAPTAGTSIATTQTDGNIVETAEPSLIPANISSGSGGLSKSAVAGISIATAVIGGAIAFVVAFMLFKRRGRQLGRKQSESTTAFMPPKREHPAYVQVSQNIPPMMDVAAKSIPDGSLDLSNLSHSSDFLAGVLPPGADEGTVRNGVVALFNQIHQHIDDFYRDVHATLTPTMENDLRKFGESSVDLADEFRHSSTPTLALKHALTVYVLGIVAPEADQQSTLFPAEVSGLKEDERSVQSSGKPVACFSSKLAGADSNVAQMIKQHMFCIDASQSACTRLPWLLCSLVNPTSTKQLSTLR